MSYELFSPFQKKGKQKNPYEKQKELDKNKYLARDEQVQWSDFPTERKINRGLAVQMHVILNRFTVSAELRFFCGSNAVVEPRTHWVLSRHLWKLFQLQSSILWHIFSLRLKSKFYHKNIFHMAMPKDSFVGINAQMPFENDECSSQIPHFSLLTLTDTKGLSLSLSHTHKHCLSVS